MVSLFTGSGSAGSSSSATEELEKLTARRESTSETEQRGLTSATFGETTTSSQQDITEILSRLDDPTRDLLSGLIPGLTARVGAAPGIVEGALGSNLDFSQLIKDRAVDSDQFIEDLVTSTREAEELAFERDVKGDILSISDRVGSTQNTFTSELLARGREDLGVRLAGLTSEIRLRGRELGTQELLSSFAAGARAATDLGTIEEVSGQSVANLTTLVDTLARTREERVSTGAESLTGIETQQQETAETLNRLLETLIGEQTSAIGTTQQQGTTRKSDSPSVLETITNLFDIFD